MTSDRIGDYRLLSTKVWYKSQVDAQLAQFAVW